MRARKIREEAETVLYDGRFYDVAARRLALKFPVRLIPRKKTGKWAGVLYSKYGEEIRSVGALPWKLSGRRNERSRGIHRPPTHRQGRN